MTEDRTSLQSLARVVKRFEFLVGRIDHRKAFVGKRADFRSTARRFRFRRGEKSALSASATVPLLPDGVSAVSHLIRDFSFVASAAIHARSAPSVASTSAADLARGAPSVASTSAADLARGAPRVALTSAADPARGARVGTSAAMGVGSGGKTWILVIHGKFPLIHCNWHFAVEPWLSDSIWRLFSSVESP